MLPLEYEFYKKQLMLLLNHLNDYFMLTVNHDKIVAFEAMHTYQ